MQKLETPYAACASASSTLAGIVASDRASAPARNNRRSAGHTDDRDTIIRIRIFQIKHLVHFHSKKLRKG
jgi:hypothetical protein